MKFKPQLYPLIIGNGQHITQLDDTTRLSIQPTDEKSYHDAQLSDYTGLRRSLFSWYPPVTMRVRMRASHSTASLRGTMGFGFWNHPFMPGESFFRPPRAVWFFFGSVPNNMALAKGVPSYGWKAATFDASRLPFWLLTPFAPLGFLLMRVPVLYRVLWPIGQWSIGVSEKMLDDIDLTQWHTYALQWRKRSASFFVDDTVVHVAPHAPRAPLGFIVWLDNQYAIVTPQGHFGAGFVSVPEMQYIDIADVHIAHA